MKKSKNFSLAWETPSAALSSDSSLRSSAVRRRGMYRARSSIASAEER